MPDISLKSIVIEPGGLAADVQVGPFTYIGPGVTVEAGAVIANNVTVVGPARIGRSCRLLPGCVLGSAAGEPGAAGVEVGDQTTIREHVVIEGGAAEPTRIGPHCLLMVGCQVGASARIENNCIFANFTRIEPCSHVEPFVQTSGFANIGAHVTVGAYSFTTGYARIDRDAPPFAILHGLPFRVRGVNVEKLRRCGFAEESIERLKQAFRQLFDGAALPPAPERLAQVEPLADDANVRRLLDSLRRGGASALGRRLESLP